MKYLAWFVRVLFLGLFIFLILKGKMILWLALYGVSLIVAIFAGRVYCGYVCPMNTLMIPVNWLSNKMKLQSKKIPKFLGNGYFSWISLLVSLVSMVIAKKVFQKNIPVLFIWLAISVLVTFFLKPEVFHKLICPFGPLQKIFGKKAIYSEKVDSESCIACMKCQKVCTAGSIEAGADKKAVIDSKLCLQCAECARVCPTDDISYRK